MMSTWAWDVVEHLSSPKNVSVSIKSSHPRPRPSRIHRHRRPLQPISSISSGQFLTPYFPSFDFSGGMSVDHFQRATSDRCFNVLLARDVCIMGKSWFWSILMIFSLFFSFFLFRCRNISLSIIDSVSSYIAMSRRWSEKFSRGNPWIHSKQIFSLSFWDMCYTTAILVQDSGNIFVTLVIYQSVRIA